MSPRRPSTSARRYPPRGPRRDLGFVALAVAVGLATAGGVIVARKLVVGGGGWHAGHLVGLVGGALLCGAGLFMLQHGLRQRARLRAFAEMMPRYREHMRRANEAGAAARMRHLAAVDDWQSDGQEWSDEGTDVPLARAEMRAATRALLVSLADELRQEASHRRRGSRPACRHARLRAAGRGAVERRRRVVVRPGRALS